MAGGHQGLPVAAFLQLAIADDDEHARRKAAQSSAVGGADGVGKSMAEGPRVRLDSGNLGAIGVAVERRKGRRERLSSSIGK